PISSGNSISVNGLTNSITVDSAPPTVSGKANELYIGGVNTPSSLIPFSKIKVGIGINGIGPSTGPNLISGDSKVKIFDPTLPALEVSSNNARGQLAVATGLGTYSNMAVAGDVILRAEADTAADPAATNTHDLILAARTVSGGAIRFTTGTPATESQKMTILPNGSVGINTPTPGPIAVNTDGVPVPLLDVNGQAR